MADSLFWEEAYEYGIVAMQEPWRRKFIHKAIASTSWRVKFHSPDPMTHSLDLSGEVEWAINIHNIYYPSPHTLL